MARQSRIFLPTLRDNPADAEAVSHRLMVRAGLIRQVGAGLWTWMPAGLRSLRKVEAIIREEMDAIGAQEIQMPVLNPAELWKRSGRYDTVGAEMFRLRDRRDAEMVLAMTHEENVTFHVANEVRSYRDLPLILWQMQTKERDEPRPRAGVLRTREFTMKDAYSFDRDEEGLQRSYDLHIEAYDRIFDRCGLDWYMVESDVGMMGGSGAHEYMAPCPAGENEVALAEGYAANVEVASARPQPVDGAPDPLDAPEPVDTPGQTTVDEVAAALGVPSGALIKAMPVIIEDERGLVLVLVRGDHRLNEIKLQNALGAPFRQAAPEEFADAIGPAGFIGPVGVEGVEILMDEAIDGDSYVCGANQVDVHLRGVQPGRDFQYKTVDVRNVEAGDTTEDGKTIEIVPAIEIGNIFKLGTRYSEAIGARYLDENGVEHPMIMGSYGIGPARIVAAAIEQAADENGISWPVAIAPWQVHLVALGKPGDEVMTAAEEIYGQLAGAGIEVLFDDRKGSPGEKLADADLIGCPLRIAIGRRSLGDGAVELRVRKSGADENVPIAAVVDRTRALLAEIS